MANNQSIFRIAACVVLAICAVLVGTAAAQDGTGAGSAEEKAALNAQASKLDPEDFKFVQPVCTVCHTPSMFLHSRSSKEWRGIFEQMSSYGARATPEQWDHIAKYFQNALSLIDVNDADEDELALVLGVDENTAIAIVRRRADRKFTSADELEAIPGVAKAKIEQMRPRIVFQRVGEAEE